MDVRLLRTFVTTARTLNFRKAANLLFLSQPAVTQHVRQLEAELRVQLFERNTKRVQLTPAGERFLQTAGAMLAVYERGVQDLTSYQQGYRERLVLAVSPLVARSTLPRAMRRFTTLHPDVDVVVHIALSPEIAAQVAEGKAHLGLSRMPTPSRDLQSEVWYTDPVLLVVPRDAGDMDSPPPDWAEVLTTERLLTHNHPAYWDDLLLALHQKGLALRTMEVSQVDITKRFIEEGLGVSFLPHSTVWRELTEGRLLEVPTPGLELPVAATHIIAPDQRETQAAQAFRGVLHELMQ